MKKLIGNKSFYKTVMAVALPVILQNVVTNFVNMLDNIMVGQLGTREMSAVSVANQLLTIFNLAVFGSTAAAGIFGAQYIGRNDMKGAGNCLKAKYCLTGMFCLVGIGSFLLAGRQLLGLYINADTNTIEEILYTSEAAYTYLKIMCIGLIPFALTQSIGSSVRETGSTTLPMIASWTAVAVNFIGNLLLIFGLLGFKKLGISGAAIATVISRFVELMILIAGVRRSPEKYLFFRHVFDHRFIPKSLAVNILKKGTPMVVNEILWSTGMAAVAQCYSLFGLDAVAAFNISNTIQNIFITVFIGMGSAIGILVGQKLGAGEYEKAYDWDIKMIFLCTVLCAAAGILLFMTAHIYPDFYQTDENVKALSTVLLRITAVFLPASGIYNCCYFTLRSGGKTFITFLFDGVSTIAVVYPCAFILSRFTSLSLIQIFFCMCLLDVIKAIIGLYLVRSKVWISSITV